MPPSTVKPRIEIIDALRGLALMGLFLVHMVEYFELYWLKPEPGPVHDWIFLLFGGKAYGVFAMLFGLSFFIIMAGAQRRGVDFRRRFIWRLTLLWGFGYVHSLIYNGDILQMLAITGLVLVLIHPWSDRAVAVISALLLLQIPSILRLIVALGQESASWQPAFWAVMGDSLQVLGNGTFLEVTTHNAWHGQYPKWLFAVETGRLWNLMGLIVLGLLIGRSGFFHRVEAYRRRCWIGLGCAVAMALAFYHFAAFLPSFPEGQARWIATEILDKYSKLALTCAGTLAFILAYQAPFFRRLLRFLAPCGRMSLTIYVGQAFLFVPLFYGYGLAWHESLGQAGSLAVGIVAWLLQMVLANYWLTRFQYGPLEWLWRSATYLRADIPLRKMPCPAPGILPSSAG